jgi:hypothetical protein
MELAAGSLLFERFVYGDPKDDAAYEVDFARALEDRHRPGHPVGRAHHEGSLRGVPGPPPLR